MNCQVYLLILVFKPTIKLNVMAAFMSEVMKSWKYCFCISWNDINSLVNEKFNMEYV